MKPFESIVKNSAYESVRKLVLEVIQTLVYSSSDFIASGWINVFSCIKIASKDKCDENIEYGFKLLQTIKSDYLEKIPFYFVEFIECNFEYTCCENESISSLALTDVELCASQIQSMFPVAEADKAVDLEYNTSKPHLLVIDSFLSGLSKQLLYQTISNAAKTVTILFNYLINERTKYSIELWEYVIKNYLQTMIFMVCPVDKDEKYEEYEEMLTPFILNNIVDFFLRRFEELKPLIPSLYQIFKSVICQGNVILVFNRTIFSFFSWTHCVHQIFQFYHR